MLKYNNHQLSEPSEKNLSLPQWSSFYLPQKFFFSSIPVLMCAQCALNLICSQPLTPHSCLLKENSLCIYMFRSSRYGLERIALVLGHEDRLEELLLPLEICSSSLKMLSQIWKGSTYLRRRGEVLQLSVPFLAFLDHKIILCLLAMYSNNNKMNLQRMQFSGFTFFILSLEVSWDLLWVSPASPATLSLPSQQMALCS